MTKLIGLIFCLQIPFFSYAQEVYFSGTLGLGSLNEHGYSQDKFDNELAYGLRGGFVLTEHLSGGLMLQRLTTRDGLSSDVTSTNIMGEFTYHCGGTIGNGLLISGLFGLTQLESDGSQFPFVGFKDSGLSGGLGLGYQFMVNPNFSLSPQVSYIYISDVSNSDLSQTSAVLNLSFWY